MESALEALWKSKKTEIHAGSYSEPRQFYNYARQHITGLTRKDVDEFVKKNPAYFVFRHPKKQNRADSERYVHSTGFGDILFADTMYLKHMKRAGAGGIKYVFLVVDAFTDLAFGRGMKTITAKAVQTATRSILKEIEEMGLPEPKKWTFDRGHENKGIKDAIGKDMEWYYSSKFSLNKAMKAERIIAELRTFAARMLEATNVTPLTAIMSGIEHHNKSVHSRLKMSPLEASENPGEALQNRREHRWERESKFVDRITGPKFAVGDVVRMQKNEPRGFGKISDPQYFNEAFVVDRLVPSEPFWSYIIRSIDSTKPFEDSVPESLLVSA